jgi:hypothetical protein
MPRRVVLLLWMGSLVACGGEQKKPLFIGPVEDSGSSKGTSKDGGARGGEPLDGGVDGGDPSDPMRRDGMVYSQPDGGADAGDGGPGFTGDPFVPLVSFISPDPATDPNDDEVVTTTMLRVHCKAERGNAAGSEDVDAMSVRIVLTEGEGLSEPRQAPVDLVGPDEYAATVDLSGLNNGPIEITCTADDLSPEMHEGRATLRTLLDLGPTVRFLQPADESIHALNTPVVVRFVVAPAPLTDGDEEAALDDIQLSILGIEFPLPEPDDDNVYSLNIDFDDRELFDMAPSSAQLVVRARNQRTPESVSRSDTIDITLDAEGPEIVVNDLAPFQIVRGDVTFSVTVTDISGVEPSSVVAEINNGLHVLENWDVVGDGYTEKFDTRAFGTQLTQLTINVRATDLVGNESTRPHVLRLDNVPPIVDLDPPHLREFVEPPDGIRCSAAFDPVGSRATNDGEVKTVSSLYRAQIMDDTNSSPGAFFRYHADVDRESVELFAQADPTIALLIDTTGDGVCDEIQNTELPMGDRPILRALSPVDRNGDPFFSATADMDGYAWPTQCTAGSSVLAPSPLCLGTEMFRVTNSWLEDGPPSVYADNPTNSPDGECHGTTWELLPIVGEGWVCLAVRAEDNIGNVGISPPLRVCLDDGMPGNGVPACNAMMCNPEIESCAACDPSVPGSCPDCSGSPDIGTPCDWSGLGFGVFGESGEFLVRYVP